MSNIDELIEKITTELNGLFTKPKLKEKLLKRPPFRFLYDVYYAILNSTNFCNGLYLYEWKNAKEYNGNDKVAWLKRIILATSIAANIDLSYVNAAEIASGLRVENTLQWLYILAKTSKKYMNDNRSINLIEIINQVDEKLGFWPIDADKDKIMKLKEEKFNEIKDSMKEEQTVEIIKEKINQQIILPDVDLNSEDFINTTTVLVSAVINTPKMKPNYLKRPPYKFILDIVRNVIKKTNWTNNNLFTIDELDPNKSKDQQIRYSFLTKLIYAVQDVTNSQPNLIDTVHPKKITAGLQPEDTNRLLQQFIIAACSGKQPGQIKIPKNKIIIINNNNKSSK